MTANDHIALGQYLGIPDCCIQAFLRGEQVVGEAVLRGPCRTREECAQADREIGHLFADPELSIASDPRRAHVPCRECFVKVFTGSHPDGWVFAEQHDELCDIDHTHKDEAVVAWLQILESRKGAIHP